MSKYDFVKLNQICNKITDGSHYSPIGIGHGIPMLSVKDMLDNKFSYDSCKFISEKDYLDLVKSDCKPLLNDVLIAKDGSYLKHVFVVKEEINQAVLSSIGILRPNLEKVIPEYLKYYLQTKSVKETVATKYVSGSALPRIILKNFGEIDILLKNITDQQKIASVLSSLDAKIELNNQINAELEAMAKTLYDYWFVQFDFPDPSTNPERAGKPYKSSGGKMVWNEQLKREVPEGWEVKKISEILDTNKSGDWGKEEIEGNFTKAVTCIRGADINGLNGSGSLNPPRRFILEKNVFKLLEPYDIIIEISGGSPTQSTGRMAYLTSTTFKRFETPLICSNFCKPITLKNKKLVYNFAYFWDDLYQNNVFFGYEGKTTGIKNLLFESFTDSNFMTVPKPEVVDQFHSFMENIQQKKELALIENQTLTALRDWLLPMLMNGQVTVK